MKNDFIFRIQTLLRAPLFWIITFIGNGSIILGALVFNAYEKSFNPLVNSFLDSLIWSVGVVSTVGSGIHPVTTEGKIITIILMMMGALILWSYMALFLGTFVQPALRGIEKELVEEQKILHELKILNQQLREKKS